jgi:hypothetical protein
MKRMVLWATAYLSLGFAIAGCGNPCQDAFDKVKSCWSSVNCSGYPADQQSTCQQAKSIWTSATEPNQCNNPDAILECNLDPQNFCNCKR